MLEFLGYKKYNGEWNWTEIKFDIKVVLVLLIVTAGAWYVKNH